MYSQIVDSDGKGYYAYLPAIFIYHDLSFNFFFEKKNKQITRYFNERFIIPQNGKTILKTYCGESVVLLPFFLTGCIIQYFISGTITGYEPLMQFFICLGALFYLGLGLFYLRKFLRFYIENETAISLTLLFIIFGTNLFYYSAFHPAMTHVYSFSMIAAFIYFIKNYFQTKTSSSLFFAVAALAITALLRPVNILVVTIVPFLSSSLWNDIGALLKNYSFTFKLIAFFACFTSIQFLLNYAQCGKFIVWSYANEGFYFSHPEIFNVLFSFRKGLFVYTPIMLVACTGLIPQFKRERNLFSGVAITLAIATYIIASWWNWYYGPGFGLRAFVDWFALFAIPLAFILDAAKGAFKKVLIGLCIAFIALNIFQTWQYLWGIIHPEEMNKEKYSYVFLKASPEYYNCLGGGNEDHYLPLEEKPFWEFAKKDTIHFNSEVEFNINVELTDTFSIALQPVFLQASLSRLEKEFNACQKAMLVITYNDAEGKTYYYNSLRINDLPRDQIYQWKNYTYTLGLPAIKNKLDKMKVYVWNIDKRSFMVNDFQLKLFHYKKSNP